MSLALGDGAWVIGPSEQAPGSAGSMELGIDRFVIERVPLVLVPEEEMHGEPIDAPDGWTEGLNWGLVLT